MIYTPEEKQRMERLLQVFSDYIANHPYTDFAYSDKTGFVCLSVGESTDYLYFLVPDFDQMLRMLIDDYLIDEEVRVGDYLKIDYGYVCQLLTPRLEAMGPDRDHCLQFMEERFVQNRKHIEQLHEQALKDIAALRQMLKRYPELNIKI